MHESHDSYAKSLFFASESLVLNGFAVIPVFGMQNQPKMKQSPIKWGRFQHSLPTRADLQNWFLHEQYGGLAVVCGAVSRLVVLDFDDADLVSEFRQQFPNLFNTYRVRSGSRGLPHLYWRLPADLVVQSRSMVGADLRGEGTYVVAPPTRANGGEWSVENGIEPQTLSKIDLRLILGFMGTTTSVLQPERLQTPSSVISSPSISTDTVSEIRQSLIAFDELLVRYQQLVPSGRNNALFRVAVMARDSGWVQHALAGCIAPIHAREGLFNGSNGESFQQRYAEAVKTIASVYRRPARRAQDHEPASYLSNAVREALLQCGQVQTARVLDGLYLSGLAQGALFTEREACVRLAALGIPRAALLAALCAYGADDTPIFPPLTPQQMAHAANEPNRLYYSCEMSGGAKRVKNGRGRPARFYQLPSIEALAAQFGVAHRRGDPILAADLRSPSAYRLALHRELIRRRPAQYSRTWISARLGVSEWTTRRYERAVHIVAQPMYVAQDITWQNLNALLPESREAAPMSIFIEDEDGKRYPPVRGIAQHLLKVGRTVRWMQQVGSYYSVGESVGIHTPVRVEKHQGVGVPTVLNDEQGVGVPTVDVVAEMRRSADNGLVGEGVGIHTPVDGEVDGNGTSYSVSLQEGVGVPTVDVVAEMRRSADNGLVGEGVGIHTPVDGEVDGNGTSYSVSLQEGVGVPTPNDGMHFWLCETCLQVHVAEARPQGCSKCGEGNWRDVPDFMWRDTARLKAWWQEMYRARQTRKQEPKYRVHQPLANQDEELLAQRAHREAGDLSLRSARNLVRRYGMKAVGQGLKLLHSRRNIRNPAGFLLTVARSEHKFL